MMQSIAETRAKNAEKQARFRRTHLMTQRKNLLVIPCGPVDLDEIEKCAGETLELYSKTVAIIQKWINETRPEKFTVGEVCLALRLLTPCLEGLAGLRAKILEQRAAEARDVTGEPQQQQPQIEQTLELMRGRFGDA